MSLIVPVLLLEIFGLIVCAVVLGNFIEEIIEIVYEEIIEMVTR